jgi:hypothetical protein
MSIEHRWTPRQPTRLPVSIACRPLGVVRGRLRNISNGGAMVQLRTALPLNAPVELILPARAGASARSYRLPAIVTRCSERGTGLMFGRIEPDIWAALLARFAPRAAPNTESPSEVGSSQLPMTSRSVK